MLRAEQVSQALWYMLRAAQVSQASSVSTL
jgi:hypothetical protein